MFVGENTIFQHSVEEFLGRREIIVRPDTDKHQEPALDGCDDGPLDPDFGREDPLQECDHAANGKVLKPELRQELSGLDL